MDRVAVCLTGVAAAYEGERAQTLTGIDLTVPVGETVLIVGPNGSGKTTLLEVTNGLLRAAAGEVLLFGEPVGPTAHRLRRQVAYLPQEASFEPSTPFLVYDAVMSARYALIGPFRRPSKQDRNAVSAALDAVGLSDAARRPIGRLSGGQQRKALLARALAQNARLLLLDEPTANLDAPSRTEVERLVIMVQEELDGTTLVVSHDAALLRERADRIVTLEDGTITSDQRVRNPETGE